EGVTLRSEGTERLEAPSATSIVELTVPDIGDFADIPVIEVLIKAGDEIAKEHSIVTLESDKASMEVPSTASGTVQDVRVKIGDKVAKGTVIATVAVKAASASSIAAAPAAAA